MTRPVVLWIDETGVRADELGGKVNSLAELTAAGFDVPPAFGITISAFARFAQEAGLPERVARIQASLDLDDHAVVADASARIAAMIAEAPMPPDIDEAIRTAYGRLGEGSDSGRAAVAIRSSGANEDLEGASFAGQYDTYLWIAGADQVVAHVRRCWASLFNPEVLTYRPAGTEDLASAADSFPAMCVGVQLMVPARSAGVMFTLDPVSGDRSKIVIESCWGLGEGVVKGEVTPDLHRVDKISFEIREREVGDQREEYRFDEATGVVDRFPITDGLRAD
jgi:pyruvate,water dikinase